MARRHDRRRRSTAIAFVLLAVAGVSCARSTDTPADTKSWQFVRGGLLCPAPRDAEPAMKIRLEQGATGAPVEGAHEIRLGDGRRLFEFDWEPGEVYEVSQGDSTVLLKAPEYPAPGALWRIALEDVSHAAAGGASPDCVVAFAPDSRRLAIGSFGGWIRIVDCYSGGVLWSNRLAEGMVKRLAWSPAGDRLYAGEQSPDGRLWAFDIPVAIDPTSQPRVAWSVRLADQLETSRPPAHDRFGIYTLPAAYELQVADDGRVFVAGTHRWAVDGESRSRSLLACYRPDGHQVWQFPPTQPTEATAGITFFAADRAGKRIVFLATESSAATADSVLMQLDGETGQVVGQSKLEPLTPYFDRAESWDSVSIADDGQSTIVGLNDGRALWFDLTEAGPRLRQTFELATPQLIGSMPIAASASYARFHGRWLCLQTQNTHIPFGSPQAANRPPLVHPGANTLTVCGRDGQRIWLYHGPYALTGSWTDRPKAAEPRWLAVMCREQPDETETGNFGFLLFDLDARGGGNERLVYYYPTEGPAMFSADVSPDGRFVAVVETPAPSADGRELYGAYQVHIVH